MGSTPAYANSQRWVQRGMRGRLGVRRARFSGPNVVYDEEGYECPIDNETRICMRMEEQSVSEEQKDENQTKNKNDFV